MPSHGGAASTDIAYPHTTKPHQDVWAEGRRSERCCSARIPGTARLGQLVTENRALRGTEVAPGALLRARKETRHGCCNHAPAVGERCPLRTPDPPVEPEDEAVHRYRA